MVRCSACGAESDNGKRFCGDCGAGLDSACPSCGAASESGKRFCGDCGVALDPSVPTPPRAAHSAVGSEAADTPIAPISERRMCSMLFVDLVGFTTVSEGRDPEEVRELLSRYFEVATTIVTRYGGVIEKFIGDAVMAVWGTPVATEQDAERAVRAALDLVDAVAHLGVDVDLPTLAARAGLFTGEVAVTIGAVNEGMVAGDSVNTAARIQSVAGPGEVFVDVTTRRLTEAAVAYDDAGTHDLKGKETAEHLWRAVRVVSNVGGEQRVDGLEAPLVARNPELRAIRELFHAAADRRQPRLVLLSGVAGVGKSRLGWEFDKYVDGLADTVLWHRGRCLSYGQGLTFWALAEAVRQRLSIAEEDPPSVAAVRLEEGLEAFVSDPKEREFVGVRLGRLLGVPVDTDSGQAMPTSDLFAGWRRFFERMAEVAPVVMLIEDAHNASPDLLEFLDHLVDWSNDLPIFVLVMARPEVAERRQGFGSGRNRVHIALDPLDDVSMDQLVDHLVPSTPPSARRQIVERAQGVPLYAVESIRALIDRDVVQPVGGAYRLVGDIGELGVPDSLNSLLAARLDSLEPHVRRVVTDAAVLGSSFPPEALGAISSLGEEALADVVGELVQRGVFEITSDRLSPERGRYRFSQEMLRQVAYESLSRRDRKARHLAVAQHLRATFPGDGEEVIDVVARHYLDALDAVPGSDDVDELNDLVVDTLIRAAKRAERTGAWHRVLDYYDQAGHRCVVAGRLLDAAGYWVEGLTRVKVPSRSPAVVTMALGAKEIYEQAGMRLEAARATALAGQANRRNGRLTEARSHLFEAWAEFEEDRSFDTLFVAQQISGLEIFSGDLDAADRWSAEVMRLCNELGAPDDEYAAGLDSRGLYHHLAGDPRRAIAYAREAVRLQGADIQLQTLGMGNLVNLLNSRDPVEAVELGRSVAQRCTEHGMHSTGLTAITNLVWAYLSTGEWDAACDLLFSSQLARASDGEWELMVTRAAFLAIRGDESARSILDALDPNGASEDPQDLSALAAARAFVAHTAGDLALALDQAVICVDFLRSELPFASDDGRTVWPLAARVAHELERFDVERDLLALCVSQPLGALAPMQLAEAALIRARLAAVDGLEEADDLFREAIAGLRQRGTPYLLAHGLIDYAEFSGDESADAALALSEAADIARRLKCTPLATRAANPTSPDRSVVPHDAHSPNTAPEA